MPVAPSHSPASPELLRILHLEDSELDHHLVRRTLQRSGLQFVIDRVDSLEAFTSALNQQPVDLVLADYRLPGFTALDAWSGMSRQTQSPPFILLSGAIGESAAVAAIHLGISDFVHKDELGRLERVIRRTLEVHAALQDKARADAELAESERRLAGFAEHLQQTIEQERAAIAREIHDDIGGSLAAVRLDLAWLTRHLEGAEAQSHVRTATEMLQHAIGASQRIMMNLRPSILDQGICAAVQWLAQSFERRTGIETRLHASRDFIALPKPVELTAYRTAQEALTNVSKYAQCSLVRIELSNEEDFLTLEVSDNGKGIAAMDRQKTTAFGLKGLQERARTVGGWLDISSREGSGTSIILSVPLTPPGVAATSEPDPA